VLYYRLSLVDCFLLSVAKVNGARVFTTDHKLRDAAKKMKVNISYLPFMKR